MARMQSPEVEHQAAADERRCLQRGLAADWQGSRKTSMVTYLPLRCHGTQRAPRGQKGMCDKAECWLSPTHCRKIAVDNRHPYQLEEAQTR